MAHLNNLQAGIYTYLDLSTDAVATSVDTTAEYAALFVGPSTDTVDSGDGQVTGVANHKRVPSVREFPSIGTPANIVNVPVYGQKTSSQIQGQSDAPSLEVTINYVADDMTDFHALIGKEIAFRFMMVDSSCTHGQAANSALSGKTNTAFFWKGKIEAILINPSLTDQTTATMTLSAQTDFFGPYTK